MRGQMLLSGRVMIQGRLLMVVIHSLNASSTRHSPATL